MHVRYRRQTGTDLPGDSRCKAAEGRLAYQQIDVPDKILHVSGAGPAQSRAAGRHAVLLQPPMHSMAMAVAAPLRMLFLAFLDMLKASGRQRQADEHQGA